ncbi:hypothetical protein DICSQDRAFT_175214 [Dichomitus squalens LYAD-421 SS1]|uniref:Protein kinase domain-containing protein n=1 Tax=Dichomitus squalens (strain LYAD-421) TaxID=732165 RepID=R7SIY7_DICSQ|nr:uncharacterized protein DICSQDRAFT_175214 [Dichomitus squalens LYAD-421 SS1]EJF56104.1 hypothetical protein DICSQDRAFT_175214 [Dichomitus squalens LYAD-421 SS1]
MNATTSRRYYLTLLTHLPSQVLTPKVLTADERLRTKQFMLESQLLDVREVVVKKDAQFTALCQKHSLRSTETDWGRECEPSSEVVGCVPLHVHDTKLAELEAGDRLLAALRIAVHTLRERYPDIANSRRSLAHFPFREFYVDDRGVRHEFTYLTAIDEKRVFRVETLDTETSRLVVKFSRQYSEAAHRAAHALGLAPALHAVNKVYDWYMIVMEDMPTGYTTMWDLKRESSSAAMSLEGAQDTIKTKLAELHRGGFVHGDVRDLNVLVRDKSTATIGPDVLLVDWDWAGVKAEARYPCNVNQEIARPKGATSGDSITEEHDMWMAGRLIQRV